MENNPEVQRDPPEILALKENLQKLRDDKGNSLTPEQIERAVLAYKSAVSATNGIDGTAAQIINIADTEESALGEVLLKPGDVACGFFAQDVRDMLRISSVRPVDIAGPDQAANSLFADAASLVTREIRERLNTEQVQKASKLCMPSA